MSGETDKTRSDRELILGLLGASLIVLKLCHVIDWSWWWVLAPFWGPFAFAFAILAVMGLIFLVAVAVDTVLDR